MVSALATRLLPPAGYDKPLQHLPVALTWAGICALGVFCSVSTTAPGPVLVAGWALWLSVAGLGAPGCSAPVLTSDPFPKARMAFSRTQEEERRCDEKASTGS